MSSKDTINVKSNGLRNELKEIRKSIDKLTITLQRQTETFDHIADSLARLIISQTNTQNEKNNLKPYWEYRPDRMWYTTSDTSTESYPIKETKVSESD